MNKFEPHKSSLGIDANLVMLIAYLGAIVINYIPLINIFAWSVPLLIYFIEKDSKYVKFHAMQSLLLEAVGFVFAIIVILVISAFTAMFVLADSGAALGIASIITLLFIIFPVFMFAFSIVAIIKGWSYECYKIPLLGRIAEKLVPKN